MLSIPLRLNPAGWRRPLMRVAALVAARLGADVRSIGAVGDDHPVHVVLFQDLGQALAQGHELLVSEVVGVDAKDLLAGDVRHLGYLGDGGDQGVDADPSGSLSVTCAHGCARGQAAMVEVSVGVDLPGFASLGIGRDVVVVDTERSITLPGKEEQ